MKWSIKTIKSLFVCLLLLPFQQVLYAQVSDPDEKQQLIEMMRKRAMKELEKDSATRKQLEQMKNDPAVQQMQRRIDSINKANPGLNISSPFSSGSETSATSSTAAKGDVYASYAPMPPQQNPSHHAAQLPALNISAIKTLAQSIVKNASIDATLRSKLDTMAKDPALNVTGTGAFYLSLGLSPDACAYLIAKGILQYPGDPYAANSLGVYYRDKNKIKEALQCFFYADKLLPASVKSPYIYANIGWASFYYGDYMTAQKYFNKSLAISSQFQPALEGQATLAFARGDTKALFQALAKELLSMTKTAGGSAAIAEPSSAFTGVCGGVFNEEAIQKGEIDGHIFDNLGVEDNSPEQDPPPGADVTYPALFKPVFINDVKEDVMGAVAEVALSVSKGNNIVSSLRAKQQKLDARFVSRPHTDEEGNIVFDKDYTKFLNLHGMMIQLLESRVDKHIKDFEKYAGGYNEKVSARYSDMVQQYNNELKGCGDNAACAASVQCKWIAAFHKEGNNFLDIGAREWEKMYDWVIADIQWFLKNDAAFVSRVHDVKCNEFLNIDREMETRIAILQAYDSWSSVLSPLELYSTYARLSAKCAAVQMGNTGAPDPFIKRPKHIKVYEEKCKDFVYGFEKFGITSNCHYLKFNMGADIKVADLGLSYTKVTDKNYAENHNYTHVYGTSIGSSVKVGSIVEIGGKLTTEKRYNDKGDLTGSTKTAEASASANFQVAKVSGKVSRTCQYDGQGNLIAYSNNVSGNAAISNVGSTELRSSSNYDKYGNYTGGKTQLTTKSLGVSNLNIGTIQVEMVAGQNQITPP